MIRYEPGNFVTVGDVKLMVVARLVIQGDSSVHYCALHASKEPYALVIRDVHGLCALDAAGQRLSLTSLVEEIPELESLL
ncbi:MAG: hypothetical protein AMS22_02980 [Thiotrichales bacterium SG8_50]|nr:MAG: hypothetical protein AMS22_02980 [Thiotrichales bacterium SG8_50]